MLGGRFVVRAGHEADAMKIERYVAIGDSQTEGLHDYYDDGELRGWADRFAGSLAAAGTGQCRDCLSHDGTDFSLAGFGQW